MAIEITTIMVEKSGGHNIISLQEFLKMPTSKKIELAVANKLVFLDDKGENVPLDQALEWIKSQ